MTLSAGRRVGGFTLLRGRPDGGWWARADDGREVVVRLVPAGRLGSVERWAGLGSPYVVPVLGAGRHEDCVWVTTEPPVGPDLRAYLAERAEPGGGLPPAEALAVVRQAATGVAAAHERGLVHGALGPAAVQVAADGSVRVDGFGLTRAVDDWDAYDHTAPERHAGLDPTPAGDVYSLGCLLWLTLTGRPPYPAATPYDAVRAHVDAEPPRLVGSSPVVRRLNAVLSRALAKPSAARQASAADLAADLAEVARVLADQPTERLTAGAVRETPPRASLDPPPMAAPGRSGRPRWPFVVVGVVLLAVAGTGMWVALGGDRPVASVTCWDDRTAASAADCSAPDGRAGFAHVFPSFADRCETAELRVTGKTDVYVCEYAGYLVRYSRWDATADRSAYYTRENPGAQVSPWRVDEVTLGTQWVSYDRGAGEDKPYQWSATYADQPFSVSVEAVSLAARAAGRARVEAVAPRQVRVAG